MSNDDTEIPVIDINESYIEEMITEKSYECISESLCFINEYTYENRFLLQKN